MYSMPFVAICPECGHKQKFADADEGQMARCAECSATLAITRKSTKFVQSKKKKKEKKLRTESEPPVRLSDVERKEIIRVGKHGIKFMQLALLVNLIGFVFLMVSPYTANQENPEGTIPWWIVPLTGLVSTVFLILATLQWRTTAHRIERGQVVQVGTILGPILLLLQLLQIVGWGNRFVVQLGFFGTVVYLTLLVVFIERIITLSGRTELQELANRTLSWSVGVLIMSLVQQYIAWFGIWVLAVPMMAAGSLMTMCYVMWCIDYFRLLLYCSDL
jgi:hypothetical protein